MATTKTASSPKASTTRKTARRTDKAKTTTPKVSALSVGAQTAAKLAQSAKEIKQAAHQFEIVSSLNLRRTMVPDADQPQRVSMWLSESDFRSISAAGIAYGVTFDEVIRGLITQEQAMLTPFASLDHFMPAATV